MSMVYSNIALGSVAVQVQVLSMNSFFATDCFPLHLIDRKQHLLLTFWIIMGLMLWNAKPQRRASSRN
jgi:hypothetical protein